MIGALGRSLFQWAQDRLVGRRRRSATLGDVYESLAVLREPGCGACVRQRQALRRFYFWYLIETYGQAPGLLRVQASWGFCANHTPDLLSSKAAYQLSYVAQCLGRELWHRLKRLRGTRFGRQRWAALERLRPTAECPACETLAAQERWTAGALARVLLHPEVSSALPASPGLCLRHLLLVATRASGPARALVLEDARRRLRTLDAALQAPDAEGRRASDEVLEAMLTSSGQR